VGHCGAISWTPLNHVDVRHYFVGAGIHGRKDVGVAAAGLISRLDDERNEMFEVDFGNRKCVGILGTLMPSCGPGFWGTDGDVMIRGRQCSGQMDDLEIDRSDFSVLFMPSRKKLVVPLELICA
jgi:hypothetical protein